MGGGEQRAAEQGSKARVPRTRPRAHLLYPPHSASRRAGGQPKQDVPSWDPETIPSHTALTPRAAAPLGAAPGRSVTRAPAASLRPQALAPYSSGDFPAAVVGTPWIATRALPLARDSPAAP